MMIVTSQVIFIISILKLDMKALMNLMSQGYYKI